MPAPVESFRSAKKSPPKKVTSESLLLLSILVLVLLFVGSLFALKHPAGSVLFPISELSELR